MPCEDQKRFCKRQSGAAAGICYLKKNWPSISAEFGQILPNQKWPSIGAFYLRIQLSKFCHPMNFWYLFFRGRHCERLLQGVVALLQEPRCDIVASMP